MLLQGVCEVNEVPFLDVTLKGGPTPAGVPCWATRAGPSSKLVESLHPRKIDVTSKAPVGAISIVTLIRTDTTLDHSQKAEKVWGPLCPGGVEHTDNVNECARPRVSAFA